MSKIYVVVLIKLDPTGKKPGTLPIDPKVRTISTRTVGWYPNLSAASSAIRNNRMDIAEGEYHDYAVIEETPAGVYAGGDEILWYWRDHMDKQWLRMSTRPGFSPFTDTIHFGIG